KNSVSLSSSSRIRPLKLSTKAFWIVLPGAMKCQLMLVSLHQASMALQVNSVPLSETIEPGLPRPSTIAVSSRATRRPEIDVSGIAPRHSLVTSSTTLRTRKRRPLANWSWTKSSDQRAFGRDSTRIGPNACGLAAGAPLADRKPFLPIKPVDAIDPRRLTLPPQQDEQPAITEPPAFIGKLAEP